MGVTAVAEAALQDYGDATHGASQQLRTSTMRSLGTGSPPCTVRRVGGGYAVAMVDEPLSPTLPQDTLLSSLGTQQQLSPEDAAHPVYSDADLSLVREILLLTEARVLDQYQRGAGSSEVTLAKLLKAYDKVLPLHGIQPQEDVFYYRILLRLSLDPEANWWTKFEALVRTNARRQALSSCTSPTATGRFTGTGALRTLSKAAASADMQQFALLASQQLVDDSSGAGAAAAGAGVGSSSSRTAEGTLRATKQRATSTTAAAASAAASSSQRAQRSTIAAGAGAAALSGGTPKASRRASAPGAALRAGHRTAPSPSAAAAGGLGASTLPNKLGRATVASSKPAAEKHRLRPSSNPRAPTAPAAPPGPRPSSATLRASSRASGSTAQRPSSHPLGAAAAAVGGSAGRASTVQGSGGPHHAWEGEAPSQVTWAAEAEGPHAAAGGAAAAGEASYSGASDTPLHSGQLSEEEAAPASRAASAVSWRAPSPSAAVTTALQRAGLAAGMQASITRGASALQQQQQQQEVLWLHPEASGTSDMGNGSAFPPQAADEHQQQQQRLMSVMEEQLPPTRLTMTAAAAQHASRISHAASTSVGAPPAEVLQLGGVGSGEDGALPLNLRAPRSTSVVMNSGSGGLLGTNGQGLAAAEGWAQQVSSRQQEEQEQDQQELSFRPSVAVSTGMRSASASQHVAAGSGRSHSTIPAAGREEHDAGIESLRRSRSLSLSPSPERHLSAGRHQGGSPRHTIAASNGISRGSMAPPHLVVTPQQEQQRLSALSHIQQLAQQQQQLELQLQLEQQRQQAASPGAGQSSSKRSTVAAARSYSAALPGRGMSLASTLPAAGSQPRPSSPMQRSASAAPGVLPGVSFSTSLRSRPSSPFELHSQRPSTPPVAHLQPSPSGALAGSRSASPSQVYMAPRAPSPSSAYTAPRASSPSAMLGGAYSGRSPSPSAVPVQWPTAWQQQSLGARPGSPGSPGSRPGSPWGVFESRPGSPWGFCSSMQPASPPPRIAYMQAWELEQYQHFLKASAEQGMWQQHRNVYQAATDVQDRAIAAWRLAASFWEVHLARRCLRRWRRRAARASANASTSQRRWLLLCCFRWWLSMARHYRASRAAAMMQTASTDMLQSMQQQLLQGAAGAGQGRGGSPTPWHQPGSELVVAGQHFGVNVSLQQQLQDLELQIAAATQSKITWRDRLAATFYAWREVAGVRGVFSQQERELRKHHEKQLRLQVWDQWRAVFEARSRHLLLLRALYKRRRLRLTALVLAVWRRWAPAKRASRRAGRDARILIIKSSRRRMFQAWHTYAAARAIKRRKQQLADQHFSGRQLQQCLHAWRALPPLSSQLRDLAEQRAAIVLAKSAHQLLGWWREWTRRRLRKKRMMDVVVDHMERGLEKRCIQAWKAALKRRKQLDRQALVVGRVVAANKTAACFHAWLAWVRTRQRHRRLLATGMQQTAAMTKLSALSRWRWWVVERQREVEVCEQIMRFDLQQVWRATWQRWAAAYAARQRLYAARDELLRGMLRRVVRHWKAWVDKKADWRAFSEDVMTKIILRRARVIVQRWRAIASRNAQLRALLGAYTDAARLQRLQLAFALWRQRLEQTAAKQLKALAALTQWEQGLAGKAWRQWRAFYERRKHKQLQELRAASYAAVRLMDTALMSWVSYWAEARDFAQKAEFFRAGREVQLQLQVLREWQEVAREESQDRVAWDRAVAHRSYHLLLVAFFNWRNVTYQSQMQQQQMSGALAYWAAGSLARAFTTWRLWAARRAEQRYKAGQYLDVLMGRNVAWAFAMLRANANRKKASALARIHYAQTTVVKVLRAWRQRAEAARGFRRYILSTGEQLQRGLLRDAFRAWRVTADREARLRDTATRALEKMQGTSKRAVLMAWMSWAAAQQHKRAAIARALAHWQRSYLASAFNTWREWARLAQVARHVTSQLRGRTLAQVFTAWRTWAAGSSWRRQVEDHLSGKHQFMLLRGCWDHWRSYAQQSVRKRAQLLQAASYMQNALLGKAFRKWRHVVHELRHKQTRLQYVLSHWQHRHLAAALYAWREFVAARKQKREVLEAVVLHWQAGTLQKAFTAWKEATQQRNQERDQLGLVLGHWQGNVLLKAFRGWREGVELRQAKRALLQQVVARWQQGHMRRAFDAWRDSCARLQQQKEQLDTVVRYWTAGALMKAFRGWRAAAQERKGRRAMLERVVARWQQGVKAAAFAAWRQHATLSNSRKHLLHVVGSKLANATLLRAFNGWREAAARRAELRKLLGVAMNRWTQGSLSKAFHTWQDWARLKRLKRRVVARWQQALLQRAFHTWRDNLQQQREASAAQALALAKCANSTLWKAFNTWKDFWQQRRRLQAAASAVITRWQQQALSRAFNALREHAVYRRMLKGVVVQWQHNTVSRAFEQWLAYTRYKRHLAQAHDRLASRTRRRLVVAAWAAWKQASWEGPQERAAAQFHRRKLLSAGIKAWRQASAEAQQRQQRYAIAAARWRNMGLSKAWSTWRAWAADQQYKRQALAVAAGQWRNVRLGAAFRTWRQRTQDRRALKTVAHAVASRWANSKLAAAFSTWREFAQRQQRRRTAAAAVASRWRNMRLSAAFNTWRDATVAARQRVGLANSAASRIRNATLAAAFNGWRYNVARGKQLAAAAEAVLQQWRHSRLSTAFRSWRDTASRLAQYRQVAGHVGARWRNLRLAACFSTWRSATQRGLAKAAAWETAGTHWRRGKLSRALQGWRTQMRIRNRHMQAFVSLSGNKSKQMLRKALNTWQLYHAWCQKKAAAAEYAAQKRLRRGWGAWRSVMEQRHHKEARAGQLFVGALKRMHHSLLYTAFLQWRRLAQLRKAAETMWLTSNQRSQQQVLRAWRATAHKQASAKRLLRRLLLNTLAGAFVEWRMLAQEGAHWKKVQQQLGEVLTLEHPRVRQNCLAAIQRWSHWPLSAAFSSWQAAVVVQRQEREVAVRALKFRYYTTALKVFTGLRLAVVSGRLRAAAAAKGRRSILRRHLRAWQDGAWQQQSKVGKMSKALTVWSKLLQRRAFTTWRWWASYNRAKRRMVARALGHNRRMQLRDVLRAWRGVVVYHKPLRAAVALMQGKMASRSLRQVWDQWRAHVRRNHLLRQVLLRLRNRTAAAALRAWRARVAFKLQLDSKFVAAAKKLRLLLASRALNRWREYVQQRLHLRARALAVVTRLHNLRSAAALRSWQEYVAWRAHRRAQLASALAHWHNWRALAVLRGLRQNVEVAHHNQQLAAKCLQRLHKRTQQRCIAAWHQLAPVLHHRRTVVAYFRARHLRQEGAEAFTWWRGWAAERGRCRRATMRYWNRLLIKAVGGWLMQAQASLLQRGAAAEVHLKRRKVLRAWRVGVAARCRKRQLTAACTELRQRTLLGHCMRQWVEATYLAHMSHVALHFRVRRLGCLAVQEWHQVASERAQLRQLSTELTHQLACRAATQLFTSWRQTAAAQQHRRRVVLRGLLVHWLLWAIDHRRRNAAWRAARAVLDSNCRMRVFYTWRWFTQVRVAKAAAFRSKQAALREALALGDQVARRRKRALLAATFTAWHLQVAKYAHVARKLAGLLETNRRSCFRAWRDVTQDGRALRLKAERLGRHSNARRCIQSWAAAASAQAAASERAHESAVRHWRRHQKRRVVTAWMDQTALGWQRKQALWRVMVLVAWAEDMALLREALAEWRSAAANRATLRNQLVSFVHKRRLGCLGDYFTTWHQFTVAMQPDGDLRLRPGSPLLSPRSPSQDRRLMRRLAAMAGAFEVEAGSQDDAEVFDDLPPTAAIDAALDRSEAQQPLLQLTRGYRQRRATLSDRPWEEGEGGSPGAAWRGVEGLVGHAGAGEWRPNWDLHSVAESMRQVHEEGVPPWELPSVRSHPPPDPADPTSLTLTQLRHYQRHYQYTVRPGSPPGASGAAAGASSSRRGRSASPGAYRAPAFSLAGPQGAGSQPSAGAAPEGYYLDAQGELRRVKAWYDGASRAGSPQQQRWQAAEAADVHWAQRRPRSAGPTYGRRASEEDQGDLEVGLGSISGGYDREPFSARSAAAAAAGVGPARRRAAGSYRQYGSTGDLLRDEPLLVLGPARRGAQQRAAGADEEEWDAQGASEAGATSGSRWAGRLPPQPPLRAKSRWRNSSAWASGSSPPGAGSGASSSAARRPGVPSVLREGRPYEQQQAEERPVLFSVGVWQYLGAK